MLKILTCDQARKLDEQTISSEPIASIDLMERASLAFVRWFTPRFSYSQKVGIVCGTGNNGGDGLAIARLLRERRYDVRIWIIRGGVKETSDFKTNLGRLSGVEVTEFSAAPQNNAFDKVQVLIDALFGTGLSRPLSAPYDAVVAEMNRTLATRVAVDIPSGLFADSHSTGEIVRADHTCTFQLPKLAFMFPENHVYVGDWHVVDIGLSESAITAADSPFAYVTKHWVTSHLMKRKKFAHKGDVGRSLLVAGSKGKIGASVLAARALLRTGAGLLTVHTPGVGYTILQTAVPEAMVSTDAHDDFITSVPDSMDTYDAVGVGPGIGTQDQTVRAFAQILKQNKPVVIDADALNILGQNRDLMKSMPPRCILTPHPGEFGRLSGNWLNDFERLALQQKMARDVGCIVVLKGAHTSIAAPDGRVYFNSTGNPAMATGGSGDVLTGILTALLAQGYPALDAAILGVYAHGRAGDLALHHTGGGAITASDIVDMIPRGFMSS
jgi:hydroxyethylthiazole kinase-like uncharacterized protein yjeF